MNCTASGIWPRQAGLASFVSRSRCLSSSRSLSPRALRSHRIRRLSSCAAGCRRRTRAPRSISPRWWRRPGHRQRYEVLINGDQFFPAMLQAIAAARNASALKPTSTNRAISTSFTDALEQAAKRGVDVRVSSTRSAARWRAATSSGSTSAGCHVVDFNPPHWYRLEELNYRSHRKILVVDGESVSRAAPASPTSSLGQRAGPRPLARYPGADARAHRAAARGGLLRELHRGARSGDPRRRSAMRAARKRARLRCWFAARRPAAATI